MSGITESDAKTKWCPYVRFSDEGADLYSMSNRAHVLERTTQDDLAPEMTRCVGSACMAWRWVPGWFVKTSGRPIVENEAYEVGSIVRGPTENGFCGAFGEPK